MVYLPLCTPGYTVTRVLSPERRGPGLNPEINIEEERLREALALKSVNSS